MAQEDYVVVNITPHNVDIKRIVDNICIGCEKIQKCKEKLHVSECKKYKKPKVV